MNCPICNLELTEGPSFLQCPSKDEHAFSISKEPIYGVFTRFIKIDNYILKFEAERLGNEVMHLYSENISGGLKYIKYIKGYRQLIEIGSVDVIRRKIQTLLVFS